MRIYKNVTCAEPVQSFTLVINEILYWEGGGGGVGTLSNSLIPSREFLHNTNKYFAIIKILLLLHPQPFDKSFVNVLQLYFVLFS